MFIYVSYFNILFKYTSDFDSLFDYFWQGFKSNKSTLSPLQV